MALKRGLGKGLDSLIPTNVMMESEVKHATVSTASSPEEGKDGTLMVKLSKVEPNREQPRKNFDEDSLQELAESLKQFGMLQPILVQNRGDYYEIIAGERRWRAAKIAGLKEVPVDFSPNAIDMRNFPFDLWRKVNRNVLNLNNQDLFLPGDPMGDLSLRRTISRYLHASRGVSCRPEQIVVGAGNDYLLMLLRYVFEKTITAAFENPTYPRAWKIFQLFAGEVVTVSSDASGICIEDLEKSGAQVVYVMPSHQYPTGRMMPIGRRTELLNWAAREKERYIIEDDYDSEFRYRGKPVPSLQASDAAGKVVYMGTFSKSIAPAIRVGYMVLPEALLERYRQKCACFSCTVSRVDQAVLEQFLDSGAFERHLNRMRKSYSRKHEALLDGLKPFFRQFDLSGENAGLHLLLTDRVGRSEKELVDAARRQGVKVYGLSSALVGAAVPEAVCRATVLIGFGGLTEDEIRDGLERLAAAWLIEKRL